MSGSRTTGIMILVALCATHAAMAAGEADSIALRLSARDSVRVAADSVFRPPRPSRSPGTAMMLSALLPGAGQFYNQSYWKVPLVLGLGIYFAAEWLDNNRRTIDYRDRYQRSVDVDGFGDPLLLRYREFYKDQRDTFSWYFVILYVLNIVDAYVDAHLFDFDVGGDLAVRTMVSPRPAMHGLTVRIPLR